MKRFYLNNYGRVVVVFWTIFILLLWLQYIHLSTLVEASLFMIVLIPAIYISHLLANVLLPKALHNKKMKLFMFQFIGISLLIAFMLAASYKIMMWAEDAGHFPHSVLLEKRDSLLVEFFFAIPSTFVINFGFCGLRFYYENIKLQRVHLETQLQVLQSQINPHFMFNVLNHIHTLMQTNTDLASSLLLQYSDMLRFQLYKGKEEKVRLEEEIQFVQNFIEIEKLRWGKKINVRADWDIKDKNVQISPLLLITFVENAFKYASRTISGTGFVKILFRQKEDRIFLEIENSKPSIAQQATLDKNASGIGLENTRQRLNILYGDQYRLDILNTETTYYSKLEIWKI